MLWFKFSRIRLVIGSILFAIVIPIASAASGLVPTSGGFAGVCKAGLDAAAEAEVREDVSDHVATVEYLQKAIIAYGRCISEDENVTQKQKVSFYLERAHERLYLIEEFTDDKRDEDGKNQTIYLMNDLLNVCGSSSSLSYQDALRLRNSVAPGAIRYANIYGLNPVYISEHCQPNPSMLPR